MVSVTVTMMSGLHLRCKMKDLKDFRLRYCLLSNYRVMSSILLWTGRLTKVTRVILYCCWQASVQIASGVSKADRLYLYIWLKFCWLHLD